MHTGRCWVCSHVHGTSRTWSLTSPCNVIRRKQVITNVCLPRRTGERTIAPCGLLMSRLGRRREHHSCGKSQTTAAAATADAGPAAQHAPTPATPTGTVWHANTPDVRQGSRAQRGTKGPAASTPEAPVAALAVAEAANTRAPAAALRVEPTGRCCVGRVARRP